MNDNRKLNVKNKIYIVIFIIVIVAIIAILAIFAKKTPEDKSIIAVTSNNILYSSSFQNLDTSTGGEVKKNWDEEFQYINANSEKFDLGKHSLVYEKNNNNITVLGDNYQILSTGDVVENKKDFTELSKEGSSFYKLDDRLYLIYSNEISDSTKVIYAKSYLLVYIDVQGNASLINDSINVKTINPIILVFDKFIFDVANEQLIVGEKSIDLKKVIGSSNKYVKHEKQEIVTKIDSEKLLESYNKLINNFNQLADNFGASQNISNNNYVINGTSSGGKNAINKTELTKRVNLRGAVSNSTYIDVSYVVVDPENKYQTVYLLVTGNISGENATVKILLDKYETVYRINDLKPNSEYTISLGYIEVVKDQESNEKELVDQVEDVINLRTTKVDIALTISKITSNRILHFNVKMGKGYVLSNAEVSLYTNDEIGESVEVDINEAISSEGFTGTFELPEGTEFNLVLENTKYNGKNVDLNIYKKFTY